MHDTLEAVRDSMMQGLGQLTDFFGFSPVMGHLYGALLMSPTPLSLDDLEQLVSKSKASVSMTMQALERWGMVHEVWVKGDRRKFFQAESDLWKVVTFILESRERKEVGVALAVLEKNADHLERSKIEMSLEDQELAGFYVGRVRQLQSFFTIAQSALELLLAAGGPPHLESLVDATNNDMQVASSED